MSPVVFMRKSLEEVGIYCHFLDHVLVLNGVHVTSLFVETHCII